MTTTSLPGNVFITTSKEAIDKFLDLARYKITFDDYITKLSKSQIERSLICTPNKNSNLIDFEMNWGKGNSYSFILRFVETGSLFELQFLNKDVYSEVISKLLKEANVSNKSNKIDLDNELITQLNSSNSRDIYIAFGVGNKIDSWAGPFIASLTKSNFTMTDSGVREITLQFTNQEGKLRRNEIEYSKQKNLYSLFDKYNTIYKNKKINLSFEVNVPYSSVFNETIHYNIKTLLENYIISIINNADTPKEKYNYNVIVLLPSIKNLFEKTVNKIVIEQGIVEKETINKIGLDGSKKFLDPEREAALNKAQQEILRDNQQAIKDAQKFLDTDKTGKSIFAWLQSKELTPLYDETKKNIKILQRQIDVIQQEYKEEQKKASLLIKLKLDDSVKNNTTEISPDYFAPLSKFNSAFKEQYSKVGGENGGGSFTYNPTFIIENDLRVLSLWEREGFIFDKTKPAFIFGDDGMIEDLLYAATSFSLATVGNFLTNIEFISSFDKRIYCDNKQQYRKEIYLLTKAKRKNSSFGQMKGNKDDLALSEFNQSLINFTEWQDLPIFRHNISNPNVLSISVTNDTSYSDVYRMGYIQKNIIPFITDPTRLNLESLLGSNNVLDNSYINNQGDNIYLSEIETNFNRFFSGTSEQIGGGGGGVITVGGTRGKKYQRNIQQLVKEQLAKEPESQPDINRIFQIIKGLADSSPTAGYANQFLAASSLFIKDNNGNTVEVKLDTDKRAALIAFQIYKQYNNNVTPTIEFLTQQELAAFEKDTFDRLTRVAQTIDIKTLPWFSITGFVGGQQCILVGLSNITGAKERTEAFYTGLYVINGYKHVITPQEMYSEFSLSKHPASQVNINDYNSFI